MRLVMTLLVRDEADIVAANIDYHLSQGVDFVVATDNGSVDATVDILRGYEKRGLLRLLHEPADDYSQSTWVTRMARMAAVEHGADWVINNDADEFWSSMHGSLKEDLAGIPASVMALSVPRANFLPVPELCGEFWRHMTVRELRSFNSLGRPLPGKVCHRADARIVVAQGNHAVSLRGEECSLLALESASLSILHFPLRTYEQFANKIAKGGGAYARNTTLPTEVGATWRRLYDVYQRGDLAHYYAGQTLTEVALDEGLAAGALVRDHRLREYLEALYGSREDHSGIRA